MTAEKIAAAACIQRTTLSAIFATAKGLFRYASHRRNGVKRIRCRGVNKWRDQLQRVSLFPTGNGDAREIGGTAMSLRRSYIKRSAPPRKRRSKPRRGQPTKQEKAAIRLEVYTECSGRCQLRLHKQCSGERILPFDGEVFTRAHLVHKKARGTGGTWQKDNLTLSCPACHLGSVHTEGKNPWQ